MITSPQYIKDGVYCSVEVIWGLSSDTKPSDVANGSMFVEMDTSLLYFYDAENAEWLEWGADANSANDENTETAEAKINVADTEN